MEWLRTDEKREAFESLKFTTRLIGEVDRDPYYWKWVIIGVHMAMQATMVLALTGSSQLRVLSDKSAEEVAKREDAVRRLADFMELYRRVKDSERMALFVDSKPLEASADTDSAVEYLHSNLRNKFIHFLPGGWSIEVDGLPSVLDQCVQVISFLALESGNIFWLDAPSDQEVEAVLADLRQRLVALRPRNAEG